MKSKLEAFIIVCLVAITSIGAGAQGKFYTRKILLEDFSIKTTKVVLPGSNSLLEMGLKEEVASLWRLSPYEFCSQQEYESLKGDNSLYFLRLERRDGVIFLVLSKGGKEGETDNLKKGFEVVTVPVANADEPSGQELEMMGAFVDIVQNFVEDARESDSVAYGGLKSYNARSLEGKRVYHSEEELEDIDVEELDGDALIGVSVYPAAGSDGARWYRMLISSSSHKLYYYKSGKYKGPKNEVFSGKELKKFKKKSGVVSR